MDQRKRFRVELGERDALWRQWCARRGLSLNEGTRQVIANALLADADNGGVDAVHGGTHAGGNARRERNDEALIRVEVRLTRAELEAVQRRAAGEGLSMNRCIVALMRTHLLAEPHFTRQEMMELARSNQRLAAINRYLGHIARVGAAADIAQERPRAIEAIRAIQAALGEHLRAVAAVIRANLDRWSE